MAHLNKLKKPLAITMWDSSWIRRRYAGGGFENWDTALDELVERGYNAIRIDAFPHLVAKDPQNNLVETFRSVPGDSPHYYGTAIWGNQWTIYINPRKSLVEFIKKCQERNMYIGLSTWFKPTEEKRNEMIEGPDELVRVWDETLEFLSENHCLDNVIYVDILNEYPYIHYNVWLHKMLDTMSIPKIKDRKYNERQGEYYWKYINEVICKLQNKWEELDFFTSQHLDEWEFDSERDYSNFRMTDVHLWMVMNKEFEEGTGYFQTIHQHGRPGVTDVNYEETNWKLVERWNANKKEYIDWMSRQMDQIKMVADRAGIPLGNTEGWGPIMWLDHPSLEWTWVKEACEAGVRLAVKNKYSFICSSNFCHPQFKGMWEDIEWHRKITSIIKNGDK